MKRYKIGKIREDSYFILLIIFIFWLMFTLLYGCKTTESTYMVEPSDSTNYNATYILP